MQLISTAELLGGLSDLPIAAAAAWFAFRTANSESREVRAWAKLFVLLSIASAAGALVHSFVLPKPTELLLWTFILPLMYSGVLILFLLLSRKLGSRLHEAVWRIAAAAGAVCSLLLFYCGTGRKMLPFLIFSAAVVLDLLWSLFHSDKETKGEKLLMLFLALAVVTQALKPMFGFSAVALAHGWIFLALFAAYRIAMNG